MAVNDTDLLIQRLVEEAAPVKRLASPLRRTLAWMALAGAVLAAVVVASGLNAEALRALRAPGAAIEWSASVATGVLAAFAVFQVSVPGRSAHWRWLPLPAAMLWLGGIGAGCIRDIALLGSSAYAYQGFSVECARAIVLVSLPVGLSMLLMVRHAGVVRPTLTALLTSVSAAALSSAAVALIHDGETALMSLLWHCGPVLVLALLGAATGRRLFAWLGFPPARSRSPHA
jgi:hypothetical protein